ncbi:MAG: hypothetical protein OXN17_04740 [Candidatus Poribacteria bacterium]|nr:hypothetical protein [Candidatus Poribacteria bacterium]MDE0505147.1 hypothetical protein [Candidatus Poribacteria bacterium]
MQLEPAFYDDDRRKRALKRKVESDALWSFELGVENRRPATLGEVESKVFENLINRVDES